jgi:tetrahydromethanopterin S-methyltransferase subunit A
MMDKNVIDNIQSELQKGMILARCRKCGCMKETLEALHSSLPLLQTEGSLDMLDNIESWLKQMEQIMHACLGCEYCFSAAAMNIFNEAFPEASKTPLSCAFEVREQTWPPIPGEYFAFCEGRTCSTAVSTLASVELAKALADNHPMELCIVGKTETENIGIDKIIKNTITNPTIQYLILAGKDPNVHYSGKTLLALWENGVDEHMRVIGSPGKRPVLRNVTCEEVEAFRKQVQVVDMIGCEDVAEIVEKLRELSLESSTCSCEECTKNIKPVQILTAPVIQAKESAKVEMDRAGYFVIIPKQDKEIIVVEHYSYDNRLLRVIEGKNVRSIYLTIIENGWVTQLNHAAYLGKELAKAEISIKLGLEYTQDGA